MKNTKSDPRLAPLPQETSPELAGAFQTYVKVLGFVPNSVLIMQRKPKIVQALSQRAAAIWDPGSGAGTVQASARARGEPRARVSLLNGAHCRCGAAQRGHR